MALGGAAVNINGGDTQRSRVTTITFASGAAVESGSLADGCCTLTAVATAFGGTGLDGDGNGTAGDDYLLAGNPSTNNLYRPFDDVNADGFTDIFDFLQFRIANGSSTGNGTIDPEDLNAFRERFGQAVRNSTGLLPCPAWPTSPTFACCHSRAPYSSSPAHWRRPCSLSRRRV